MNAPHTPRARTIAALHKDAARQIVQDAFTLPIDELFANIWANPPKTRPENVK